MLSDRSAGRSEQREGSRAVVVEKLRMGLDNWPQTTSRLKVSRCVALRRHSGEVVYAAPNLTDTSFDTPGSCMVTP
jgi:hypothetical protein